MYMYIYTILLYTVYTEIYPIVLGVNHQELVLSWLSCGVKRGVSVSRGPICSMEREQKRGHSWD